MISGEIRDKLESVGAKVEEKEEDLERKRQLQNKIDSLQDNLSDQADNLHYDASQVEEGARKVERRAARFLIPGALQRENTEAIADAELKRVKQDKKLEAAALDAEVSTNINSTSHSVDLLENIAEQAEKERSRFIHKSEKASAAMQKTAKVAETNLERAVQKKRLALEKHIALLTQKLIKVNQLVSNTKASLEKAKTSLSKAETAAEKGKVRAEKVRDTNQVLMNVTAATKKDAKEDAKGDRKKPAKENSADKEYDAELKKYEDAQRSATRAQKKAAKLFETAKKRRDELNTQMSEAKNQLKSLQVTEDKFKSVATTVEDREPLAEESQELSKDEDFVHKAQVAAKAVKRNAREHMKNEAARNENKNLILKKEVDALKQTVAKDETIIAAEKQKEPSESEQDELAKAKIVSNGAKKLMEEAQKEQTDVVDKEKLAAMNIIAEMKGEVKRQAANLHKKDEERTAEAKKMLAEASAMLLRAKAVTGTALKGESEKVKRKAKRLEDMKRIDRMSFNQLKTYAKEQFKQARAGLGALKGGSRAPHNKEEDSGDSDRGDIREAMDDDDDENNVMSLDSRDHYVTP